MNPYDILGVARDASIDEIKAAYRKLAMENHPDRGGDTETFQKISVAYEILSDPQKRQEYDVNGDPVDKMMRELFMALIASDDYDGDIVVRCKAMVQGRIKHTMTLSTQSEGDRNRLSRVLSRVRTKGFNHWEFLIQQKINICNLTIKMADEEVVVLNQVLERLSDYNDTGAVTEWASNVILQLERPPFY